METINAIKERRSIQKFQDTMIPKEIIKELLELSIKALSGKNRQPWRFVVLQGKKKNELVNLKNNVAKILKEKGMNIGTCEISINSIDEAPVVILVFNTFSNFEEDYDRL